MGKEFVPGHEPHCFLAKRKLKRNQVVDLVGLAFFFLLINKDKNSGMELAACTKTFSNRYRNRDRTRVTDNISSKLPWYSVWYGQRRGLGHGQFFQ